MSSGTPGSVQQINGASVVPPPTPAGDVADPAAADDAAAPDAPAPDTSDQGEPAAAEVPPVEGEHARRDAWRRLLAVAVVLVAALSVVVLWARPAHEPAAPSLLPPPGGADVSGLLDETDLEFLQRMIALDSSALPLFDLMKDTPALQGVAATGAEGHRAELAALRAALAGGGGIENPAEYNGRDLPGMVLEADLAAVRDAPAEQRPAKAVALLREHLTATMWLATSEGESGRDPESRAAAARIYDAHGKLLASLPTL